MRCILAAILAIGAMCSSAVASITVRVDLLDPSDGGMQPPPGVVAVDVLVDVTDDDYFLVGGLRGIPHRGALLRYLTDPNNGEPRLESPGPANRFVTFFSQSRARDSYERYQLSGARIFYQYCPAAQLVTATPVEINESWLTVRPAANGVDGAVARVALDVSAVCDASEYAIFALGEAPPGWRLIFESDCESSHPGETGIACTTQDVPNLVGLDWGLYALDAGVATCAADFNCDGAVDIRDLTVLLGGFGNCVFEAGYQPRADLNSSGCIDLDDLALLLNDFGATEGAACESG